MHRIEAGNQNLSLEMVNRIAEALDSPLISVGGAGPQHLRVQGGAKLSGTIEVRSSKNAAVALLCASLLNRGRTVIRGIAKIEEVNRILEVLTSIGVRASWSADGNDLELIRPAELSLESMDLDAARRTRSVIMFLGPLLHSYSHFKLPYAGGCDLGARTIEPHLQVLRRFGLDVVPTDGFYHCSVDESVEPSRPITLTERGDTVTENALLAAALSPGVTVLRNASPNYMVQDLCVFLTHLGVEIDGIGTTTLRVHGVESINTDVEFAPSEDPIEAMSLLTAAIVTQSESHDQAGADRVPRDRAGDPGRDGPGLLPQRRVPGRQRTRPTRGSDRPAVAAALPHRQDPPDAVPGLNIDNLPFFAVIAATAQGKTIIHDWVYENRAIYLTELNRLGARVQLLDPHRVIVEGPHPLARPAGGLPARAAARGLHPARHARRPRRVRSPRRLRDQPRLRGSCQPAQRPRREHRGLPRLSPVPDSATRDEGQKAALAHRTARSDDSEDQLRLERKSAPVR